MQINLDSPGRNVVEETATYHIIITRRSDLAKLGCRSTPYLGPLVVLGKRRTQRCWEMVATYMSYICHATLPLQWHVGAGAPNIFELAISVYLSSETYNRWR